MNHVFLALPLISKYSLLSQSMKTSDRQEGCKLYCYRNNINENLRPAHNTNMSSL